MTTRKHPFENGYCIIQVFVAGLVTERDANCALGAVFPEHRGDDSRGLRGPRGAGAARRNADPFDVERGGQLVAGPPRPGHVRDMSHARVAAVAKWWGSELLADRGQVLFEFRAR